MIKERELMSSSPTKSNSNSIFYFPAFIDTNNNQENNYEQNGGFLGILSNLFRPSKSSSTTETGLILIKI